MLKRAQKQQQTETETTENSHRKPWSRSLILATRGISSTQRYLMQDFISMIPHNKKEAKYDDKKNLHEIAEICDLRNCDGCVLFENRKHTDLYLWFCFAPNGPSIKFYVENITTMTDLKLTGNALKGSRPIISFGKEFDDTPSNKVIKEVLSKIFNVEQNYPKSKPFIDHILQFSFVDNRVWMRNYQIAEGDKEEKASLVEIGPRYCMQPIKILSGCFSGSVVYLNEHYVSPNLKRRNDKLETLRKIESKRISKAKSQGRKKELPENKDLLDSVFEKEMEVSEEED
ncbi:Ribosome biogenesis protein [Entamoeba marina]